MTTPNTAVATNKPPASIKTLLAGDAFRDQIKNALPTHLKPERFIRIALTALTRTPKLMDCTPESLFKCLLDLSALGIEPDGRRAHLIPYGRECTMILDYKGIAELVMRSGLVSNIHADVVCENDKFSYNLGEIQQHTIDFKQPRGAVYAAYAVCSFKDGTKASAVLSGGEIEAIRKRSRAGSQGPWVTDWNEMAKKTAFRRLSKWLPMSPEARDAFESDGDVIDIPDTPTTREPIKMPVALAQGMGNAPEPEPAPQQEAEQGGEPAPTKQTDVAGRDDEVRGKIEKVTRKESPADAKRPWVKYSILVAGEWYGTFDEVIGALAEDIKTADEECSLLWKSDGKYKTAVSIGFLDSNIRHKEDEQRPNPENDGRDAGPDTRDLM